MYVETGRPKEFRNVHSFRQWVIETKTRDEANIIAPCPHHHECPVARNPQSWCHFSQLTQKWPSSVFPKKPNEREIQNEKYSFLVV